MLEDYKRKKQLGSRGLPLILDKNQLLRVLEISNREATYFYSKNRKNLYRSFSIKKKSGGLRKIEAPRNDLKAIQKSINAGFLSGLPIIDNVVSYRKNKSIVDNALPHLGACTLLKFDLKDFFPSINMKHVFWLFRHLGYSKEVSRYLSLLCVNGEYVLPQGAPTSPALSNLIIRRIDERINGYCLKHKEDEGLVYTRYADDITISSKIKLNKEAINKIKNFVYHVIYESGFKVNEDKTKVFRKGQRLLVTGLCINDPIRVHVNKTKLREVDISLHCIEKIGLEKHLRHLEQNGYIWTRRSYLNHILGLIQYIKMINPEKGNRFYLKYKKVIKNA